MIPYVTSVLQIISRIVVDVSYVTIPVDGMYLQMLPCVTKSMDTVYLAVRPVIMDHSAINSATTIVWRIRLLQTHLCVTKLVDIVYLVVKPVITGHSAINSATTIAWRIRPLTFRYAIYKMAPVPLDAKVA